MQSQIKKLCSTICVRCRVNKIDKVVCCHMYMIYYIAWHMNRDFDWGEKLENCLLSLYSDLEIEPKQQFLSQPENMRIDVERLVIKGQDAHI